MSIKPLPEQPGRRLRQLEDALSRVRKTEQRLRHSRAIYQAIVENANDAIFFHEIAPDGTPGRFLEVNTAACELLQYTREELLGMTLADIDSEGQWKAVLPIMHRFFVDKQLKFEGRQIRKDGRCVSVEISSHLFDFSGNTVMVSVLRDISSRKRAEAALRDSEQRLKQLVEGMPDIVYSFSSKSGGIYYSSRVQDVLGYAPGDSLENPFLWFESIHPEDRETVAAMIGEAKEGNAYKLEYRIRDATGNWHWLLDRSIGRRVDADEIIIDGIATDITERRMAEEALRQSEERFALATAGGNVGVWDWDLKTNDMFISSNLKQMLGYSDTETVEHIDDWIRHVHPDDADEVMRQSRACIDGEIGKFGLEHRMLHKDGGNRWFLASGEVRRDAEGHPVRFVGIEVDITARKALESQLRQAHKMEAIGTLTGGIAHDFNNILAIVLGNAELALGKLPEWDAAKKNVHEIRVAALRARDVVKQLLAFSRRSEPELKPIQIGTVVRESMKLLRASIPKEVEIRLELPDAEPFVMGDVTQINQILINLATNAAQAMLEDGGTLTIGLRQVHVDPDGTFGDKLSSGDYVELSVSDNGPGIAPEHINRIFDPYFTTKSSELSSGMGLAAVHGIVSSHKGSIFVDSQPGGGCSFVIVFPVGRQEVAPTRQPSESIPRGRERILFVDDEPSLTQMAVRVLERLGYRVESATDSVEALERFRARPDQFDLLITDISMPKLSGDRLARRILEIRPDLPVILCTGFSERISEEKARLIGVRRYLEKPLDTPKLATAIRQVLDTDAEPNAGTQTG
jgi:PAS domain S-box-containing protein